MMRSTRTLALAALAAAAMLIYDVAEARLGGGRSFGAQRPSVAPRASAPPPAAASQPVMPAQPGAALPARPAPPAGSGGSRWLGPIAGLAGGLGLAAMLSHFGLPEGLGSFLLVALLLGGAVLVLRPMFARRERAERTLRYGSARDPVAAPAAFEASAAPDWGGAPRLEPVLGGAGTAPVAGGPLPPGFDAEGFVRTAKLQFARLQAAHAAGDREALRDVLTHEMFAEVAHELAAGARPATEVVRLDAEVLEVATEGDRHWASVRFSGTLREGAGASPTAFDEVWNLSKHVDGRTGWLLAGIRQLA